MAAAASGVSLNHIARATADVGRLARFYEEILGFERIKAPDFGNFQVVWLRIPNSSTSLHIIQRDPQQNLPEEFVNRVAEPGNLPRGHHISFGVSNYDAFVQFLKDKGIEIFEKTQPDGKTKQVFFFDPDGNGLEVGSWAA